MGGRYQTGVLQKGDFLSKFMGEMTPLKTGEETVHTGGVRIRSETENVLQGCAARKGATEMLSNCGFDSGVVQPGLLGCLLHNRRHWGRGQEVGGSRGEESFWCIYLKKYMLYFYIKARPQT